jgi:Ribbon-helix-helix protein, copG family
LRIDQLIIHYFRGGRWTPCGQAAIPKTAGIALIQRQTEKGKTKMRKLSLSVPADQELIVKELARRKGISVSALLRTAAAEYVDHCLGNREMPGHRRRGGERYWEAVDLSGSQ